MTCGNRKFTEIDSKIKIMIVSSLALFIPSQPPLTLDGTALKESADLVILGVTFDAKMIFEKQH